jgi:hypothetical protein
MVRTRLLRSTDDLPQTGSSALSDRTLAVTSAEFGSQSNPEVNPAGWP